MRSNLELFLLTLIRDGLGTPYELKSRADLSLGSTVPALARLEADGLVKGSSIQSRRSRRFTVTLKGLKAIQNDWHTHLQSTATDVESVLRIAYLALQQGSTDKASDFLRNAAERLLGLSMMAKAEATRFGKRGRVIDHETMRWLRARVEVRRIEAEAEALKALADSLDEIGANDLQQKPKNWSKRKIRKPNILK